MCWEWRWEREREWGHKRIFLCPPLIAERMNDSPVSFFGSGLGALDRNPFGVINIQSNRIFIKWVYVCRPTEIFRELNNEYFPRNTTRCFFRTRLFNSITGNHRNISGNFSHRISFTMIM